MTDIRLETALSLPSGFRYGEGSSLTTHRALTSSVPSLGPLTAFTGTFRGRGFNLIFRPDSTQTPTPLPVPVSGSDNVLELNLTEETLSFSPSLGSVPNRGMVQGDAFLNGIPYLQTISDVTVPGQPVGIHFEPGLWMAVPATTDPAEGAEQPEDYLYAGRHPVRRDGPHGGEHLGDVLVAGRGVAPTTC